MSNDHNPFKRSNLPYGDQQIPLHKLYDYPTSNQYLFDDEALRNRRRFGENLTYYTGTSYLSGATLGGLKGAIDGIKSAERGESMKLRVTRVLNSGGGVGRRFGNSFGVLAVIYTGVESLVRFKRGEFDEEMNSVIAGIGTGVVYTCMGGPRSAIVAGAIGGITAAAAVYGKPFWSRFVPYFR